MFNKTQMLTAAAVVATSLAASPSFADTVSYDFDPVSGQSFGATTSNSSVTVGNATFSQANASAAAYAFSFGPNNGTFSNIGGGAGTVLESGGAGANPAGAPASLTISFASTVYGINFNYANSDAYYAPNGGDTLTATINGSSAATASPTYFNSPTDAYAEGAFAYSNANGFNSITLTATDSLGAEDLVIGDLTTQTAPVPLPPGVWLLGSGLAVFGFQLRRRAA